MLSDTPPLPRLEEVKDHVLILTNPRAGARSGRPKVDQLVFALKDAGLRVEIVSELSLLAERAEILYRAGCLRAVVAAGGDGTISTVANLTPVGAPIAVLPLGTENLLAKYLGIRADVPAVAKKIVDGLTATFDAGLANGRIFLIMASCGFDAEVVRRVHAARKGHIRHIAYARPILQAMWNYQYPQFRISCQMAGRGDTIAPPIFSARWAFVANLPPYAAGLPISSHAHGSDGLLDLCAFHRGTLLHGLRYLGHILLGSHRRLPDSSLIRAVKIRIESDTEVPYQLDGDPGGVLPLQIEVLPRRLTMLVPQKWAAQHAAK